MPEGWLDRIPEWLRTRHALPGGLELSAIDGLLLLLLLLLAWWAGKALERAIRRAGARGGLESGLAPLAYAWARVARYVVWIAGSLLALVNIGLDLSSFALVAGAVGVGIGLGLQSIVGNFVAGLTVLLERTLKVGDFVDLESGVRGTVREIGFRYTRVTTNDAVDVIVPNSEFVSRRVVNWTLDNRRRRMRIPFSVAYGTDKSKVREVVLAAARASGCMYEDDAHPADVWLVKLADSGLDFQLVAWVGHDCVARPARTEAAFLWAIHDALVAAGIEIPFPQRDLRLRTPLDVRRLAPDDAP